MWIRGVRGVKGECPKILSAYKLVIHQPEHFSVHLNTPVHSTTVSTPCKPQGMFLGSFSRVKRTTVEPLMMRESSPLLISHVPLNAP